MKKHLLLVLSIFVFCIILGSIHVAFLAIGALLITILSVRFTFKTQWEINRQSREKLVEDIANKVIENTNQQKPQ